MDKKGLRLGQNSVQKSLVTEQKRDIGNGTRPWPGGGRGAINRGNNASNSILPANNAEPTRSKPRYSQRFGGNGFGNKRPQQRCGSSSSIDGSRGNPVAPSTGLGPVVPDELDDSIEPELGSVFVQGTKKQNFNHLLNFHYTSGGRDQKGNMHDCNKRGRNNGVQIDHGRWITTEKHKYNKEHYLQANCQFLVKADGDYTKYMNNPDILVEWDLIEQINIQVNEVPSCPICLYPSLAAKATRCGHVFCWSCILHYLALSDEHWRKCPICYEAIHKQHLKSVVMILHPTFPVNEQITFTLMKRLKGSLTAYPIDYLASPKVLSSTSYQNSPTSSNCINGITKMIKSSSEVTQFLHTVSDLQQIPSIHCKLVLANSDDVIKIIERERNDLLLQKIDLISVEVNPELCFVEEALALLNERQVKVLSMKNVEEIEIKNNGDGYALEMNASIVENNEFVVEQEASSIASCIEILPSSNENLKLTDENMFELEVDFDLADDLGEEIVKEVSQGDSLKLGSPMQTHGMVNGAKSFYFYQASDSQHIYLHAINARMLEHTYGSLEFAPRTINGKILEKESGSITDQLRNRVRYLQHLPVTCQVEVAEIDLDIPIVSGETMEVFRDQLNSRRKRRQLRNRNERRREKQIQEYENRQLGRCLASSSMYTPNLHLDSPNHFPTVETSVALSLAESNNNLGFCGERFRSDSERSDGDTRSNRSRSSLPKECISGSLGAVGWWGNSLDRDSVSHTDKAENDVRSLDTHGPTFAKMLQKSPKPKSQASPCQTFSQTKSSLRQVHTQNITTEDSETELDYIPAPAYNKSFSDAITMALEKASLQNDTKSTNDNGHSSTPGKKKKKPKQKVLFATSMSFTGH